MIIHVYCHRHPANRALCSVCVRGGYLGSSYASKAHLTGLLVANTYNPAPSVRMHRHDDHTLATAFGGYIDWLRLRPYVS
jgi:hypothetical protein